MIYKTKAVSEVPKAKRIWQSTRNAAKRIGAFAAFPLMVTGIFLAVNMISASINPAFSQKKDKAPTVQSDSLISVFKQKYEAANPSSTLTYAATADITDIDGGYLRFVDKKDGSNVRVITVDEVTLVTDAGTKGKNISGAWIVTPDGKTFYAYRVTKTAQMAPVSTQ